MQVLIWSPATVFSVFASLRHLHWSVFAKYLLHLIVLHFEICAIEYVTLILLELSQMVSIELLGEEALKYMIYPVLL